MMSINQFQAQANGEANRLREEANARAKAIRDCSYLQDMDDLYDAYLDDLAECAPTSHLPTIGESA